MHRIARWAAVLCLAATAAAASPASARPGPAVPGLGVSVSSGMPLAWQGELWIGRESPLGKQPPNGNYWLATPKTAFTDAEGRLHLVASKVGGNWYGVGVNTVKSDYGYGTYRFVMDTPMSALDPMAVVGMFTYNQAVVPSRQESDVELSRWGQPRATAPNGQWVIQPWTQPGHLLKFTVPRNRPMTYEFTWLAKSVTFRAIAGASPTGRVVSSWKSTRALPGAPEPGTQVYLNLWFASGKPPYSGAAQEAVIRSFSYSPIG
jgi:hypothetical protein